MKRIIASVLALAVVAGAGAASAQDWRGHDRGGHDRGRVEHREGGYDRGYRAGERRGEVRGERREFRGERRSWARGGYWPHGYGYVVNDPWRYNAYRAPYGYRWVRDDYGQLVLIAITSGLIADVIYNGGY
jgi:Ni/Co efflux regulator RcnB